MNRRKFLGLAVATVGAAAIARFLEAKPAYAVRKSTDGRGRHRGHAHFGSNPKVLVHKPGAPCGCVRCCTHASDRVGPVRPALARWRALG